MNIPKMWIAISALVAGLGGFVNYAAAKIIRAEVLSRATYGSFKAGDYERWDMRLAGEVSPGVESVADLERAARNARGMVEYATRVTLIIPAQSTHGNGTLLIDIPNRGRATSPSPDAIAGTFCALRRNDVVLPNRATTITIMTPGGGAPD